MNYQLLPIALEGDPQRVINLDNNHVFFLKTGCTNIDYVKYLEWVAEGNTPLPADS